MFPDSKLIRHARQRLIVTPNLVVLSEDATCDPMLSTLSSGWELHPKKVDIPSQLRALHGRLLYPI